MAKKPPPPEPDPIEEELPEIPEAEAQEIDEQLQTLAAMKAQMKELDKDIDSLQASIIAKLRANKRVGWDLSTGWGASVVQGTSSNFDLALLKVVDPELAESLTIQQFDKALLKEAIDLGLLDGPKYEGVITKKPNKPYIGFNATTNEGAPDGEDQG